MPACHSFAAQFAMCQLTHSARRLPALCLKTTLPVFWQVIIPHKDDVKIESLVAFRDYLVVFQRINGLQVMLVVIKYW